MHVTMLRLQKRTRDGNDVFSCCNVCHYIVWWHHRRREQVCEWHIEHTHTHRGETETHTSFRFTDVSEGETVESGAFHSECVSFLYPSLTLSITHKHTPTLTKLDTVISLTNVSNCKSPPSYWKDCCVCVCVLLLLYFYTGNCQRGWFIIFGVKYATDGWGSVAGWRWRGWGRGLVCQISVLQVYLGNKKVGGKDVQEKRRLR